MLKNNVNLVEKEKKGLQPKTMKIQYQDNKTKQYLITDFEENERDYTQGLG